MAYGYILITLLPSAVCQRCFGLAKDYLLSQLQDEHGEIRDYFLDQSESCLFPQRPGHIGSMLYSEMTHLKFPNLILSFI